MITLNQTTPGRKAYHVAHPALPAERVTITTAALVHNSENFFVDYITADGTQVRDHNSAFSLRKPTLYK